MSDECVPITELQSLVDEFNENMEFDAALERYDAADRWGQAAIELEELIGEHKDE